MREITICNINDISNNLKIAVCEYLLEVNKDTEVPLIPPTAIDWLGDGIVKAILETKVANLCELEELKEEIERLKNKKCAHQLAREFGESSPAQWPSN